MTGNITHLKIRFIYRTIENRLSWDSTFNLSHQIETIQEILFWKSNTKKLNKRVINNYDVPSITVYSDASSSGLASIYKDKDKGKDEICCKSFSVIEKTKSSDMERTQGYKILSGKYKTNFNLKQFLVYR